MCAINRHIYTSSRYLEAQTSLMIFTTLVSDVRCDDELPEAISERGDTAAAPPLHRDTSQHGEDSLSLRHTRSIPPVLYPPRPLIHVQTPDRSKKYTCISFMELMRGGG